MPPLRRDVLERLAARSDGDGGRTTTVAALAADLDVDVETVAGEVATLAGQSLATRTDDGGVRVTVTGEELLALDADGAILVDPREGDTSR